MSQRQVHTQETRTYRVLTSFGVHFLIHILHALDIIQLSITLTLLAKDDDANSATFKIPCSQWTNSTLHCYMDVEERFGMLDVLALVVVLVEEDEGTVFVTAELRVTQLHLVGAIQK